MPSPTPRDVTDLVTDLVTGVGDTKNQPAPFPFTTVTNLGEDMYRVPIVDSPKGAQGCWNPLREVQRVFGAEVGDTLDNPAWAPLIVVTNPCDTPSQRSVTRVEVGDTWAVGLKP